MLILYTSNRIENSVNIDWIVLKLQSRKLEWNHFDSNSAKRVKSKAKITIKFLAACQYLSCVCVFSCVSFFAFVYMENKRKMWHQTCVWMTPNDSNINNTHTHSRQRVSESMKERKKKHQRKDSTKNTTSIRFVFQVESNSMLASVLFAVRCSLYFLFLSICLSLLK